jgi:hypothetical protein
MVAQDLATYARLDLDAGGCSRIRTTPWKPWDSGGVLPPSSEVEGGSRTSTGSGGLRHFLELRLGLDRRDLRNVDEHDRAPLMELLDGAFDGGVVEGSSAEQ